MAPPVVSIASSGWQHNAWHSDQKFYCTWHFFTHAEDWHWQCGRTRKELKLLMGSYWRCSKVLNIPGVLKLSFRFWGGNLSPPSTFYHKEGGPVEVSCSLSISVTANIATVFDMHGYRFTPLYTRPVEMTCMGITMNIKTHLQKPLWCNFFQFDSFLSVVPSFSPFLWICPPFIQNEFLGSLQGVH